MNTNSFLVIKSSGEVEPFLIDKYMASLYKIGLNEQDATLVARTVLTHLYDKMPTRKLYGITFNEIKKLSLKHASIYSLREGLRLLGPSGFPFERLVSEIFINQGYITQRNQYIKGSCALHEIDVVATLQKSTSSLLANHTILVEVKFHVEFGHKTDIKVPLYIKARFDDIKSTHQYNIQSYTIVTNTKFTSNAINYSACAGVDLIAWGYPRSKSIESLIDRYKLYPITILHSLNADQKRDFVDNHIILHQDIALAREKKIISEDKFKEIDYEFKQLSI